MKAEGIQSIENYHYLQRCIVYQSPLGEKGRLQIRNFKILAVVTFMLSALQFTHGEYFLFIFLILVSIWFFCWSSFQNACLTGNIRRSYNAFMKSFGEDVNMSIQVDENNIEIEQGAVKIITKTCNIKRYTETDRAIIIHLDGPIYCGIFKEELDDWDQATSEIHAYAEKYNTPYIVDLTWNGNPYKKCVN